MKKGNLKGFYTHSLSKVLILLTCSTSLLPMNKDILRRPEQILTGLSLRQKIAQLCIVATISDEEKNKELIQGWHEWQPLYHLETEYAKRMIKEYNVGGVIFYGRDTLPSQQQKLTQELQALSVIPLIIAMDAEYGLGWFFEKGAAIKYPSSMAVGATADTELAYAMGQEIGHHLASIGVTMNYAPVADVNCNSDNPVIGARSFGADKELVSKMASAVMRGLQAAGVLPCAKHFPGHGDTETDSHRQLPKIMHNRERLEAIELYPYRELIKEGVPAIMIAHLEVPALEEKEGLPSSLSHKIVTELLQEKMQFNGLVITDALGMKAVADRVEPGELEVQALEAGVDILLCPVDPVKAIDAIETAVQQGRLQEEAINKKVLKILQAKNWSWQHTHESSQDLNQVLLSDHAHQLAKTLYEKAITLVKNTSKDFQPVDPSKLCIIALSDEPTQLFSQDGKRVVYLRLPYNLSSEEAETFATSLQCDDILVTIHNPHSWIYSHHEVPEGILTLLTALKAKNKNMMVAIFGSPYSAKHIQNIDVILLGYDNNSMAHQAVLDVVTGKIMAQGKLPISM
jgi:beta-glucosidase-like glycosyl hydrolase